MSYVHFVYTCIEILSMYTRLFGFLGAGHAETLLKNMSRKGFFPPKKSPPRRWVVGGLFLSNHEKPASLVGAEK